MNADTEYKLQIGSSLSMFWHFFISSTAGRLEREDYHEAWIGKETAAANFKALPSKCWSRVNNITEYLS
jgi:hypothetical protein